MRKPNASISTLRTYNTSRNWNFVLSALVIYQAKRWRDEKWIFQQLEEVFLYVVLDVSIMRVAIVGVIMHPVKFFNLWRTSIDWQKNNIQLEFLF